MFGNLGQLASLMKNAGAIKQGMADLQERMKTARHTGEAGGGQVRATVDGRGELQNVKIEPALVQAGDVEMIEDLVCAAIRDANTRAREAAQQEMQSLTGGLGLPGLDQMLGGGQ
jgi:DNA-binding YbaB/EbfC family protein